MIRLFDAMARLPGFARLRQSDGRLFSLAALALLLAIGASEPALLVRLRGRTFDAFQSLRPRHADQDLHPVMIVQIDEASLRAHGQWPWPRDLLARLVATLSAQTPAAIGIDILFPESDRLSPDQLLTRLPEIAPAARAALAALPSNDRIFASSLADSPSVLAVDAFRSGGPADNSGVPTVPVRMVGVTANSALPSFDRLLQSIPQLASAAKGSGAISVGSDGDAVVRRVPAAIVVGGRIVPSLGIEMIRQASGAPELVFEGSEEGLQSVAIGDLVVPTDRDGGIWIPFSPHEEWRMISASDVLAGRVPEGALSGRFVLIGATAEGTSDVVMTPLGKRMWGIEVHAQLIEALLAEGPLRRPVRANAMEILASLLVGGLVIVLMPRLSPWRGTMVLAALAALLSGLAFAAFAWRGLLLDPVRPVATGALLWPVALAFAVARLEAIRRELDRSLQTERERAQRLDGELQAARRIQMGILPRRFPAFPSRTDFDVHAMIVPARSVGGDLYDFFLLDDDHLFFMIGDVSGKGVPASLFMAITKALYKRNALHQPTSIGAIMTEANREISSENSEMLFVTAFAGILDLKTGDVEFCNAGHDHPYRLRPGSPPERLVVLGGPPLCAVDDFEFEGQKDRLEPGDTLVLFTDGVPEAMTKDRVLYGMTRVGKALVGLDDATPSLVTETLYKQVMAFANGAEQSDDICILAIRRS